MTTQMVRKQFYIQKRQDALLKHLLRHVISARRRSSARPSSARQPEFPRNLWQPIALPGRSWLPSWRHAPAICGGQPTLSMEPR